MHPFRFLACGTAVVVALITFVHAQQPTFRGGIELVEVDAIVTDGRGRPVKDLTRDDFEILEDGRPQALETFAVVDIPVTPAPRAVADTEIVEPDITTNAPQNERRLWV